MIKDLRSKIAVEPAIAYATASGTVTGAGDVVDTLGYNSVTFLIHPHSAHSTSSMAFEVQDGTATGAVTSAVSDTYLVGVESGLSFASATTGDVRTIGYIGGNRYVRLKYTANGTATGCAFSAVAVLGNADKIPTVSATA